MGDQEISPLAKKVWIPVEQATIPFYGHELVAVRLEDGRIPAVLRWLFESMGLHTKSQMAHIQGRKALAKGLLIVLVKTDGGPQEMPSLTLDALPGWLITVDEQRVKAVAREDVVRFQEKAVQVLAKHFAQRHVQALALPALQEPTSLEAPNEPPAIAPDASSDERRIWRQVMREWLDKMDEVDAWKSSSEARQTALAGHIETVEAQVGEITRISQRSWRSWARNRSLRPTNQMYNVVSIC